MSEYEFRNHVERNTAKKFSTIQFRKGYQEGQKDMTLDMIRQLESMSTPSVVLRSIREHIRQQLKGL